MLSVPMRTSARPSIVRWTAPLRAASLALFLPACASQMPAAGDESFAEVQNVSAVHPAVPPALRILSWNVRGHAAARDAGHLRSIAAVIRESGADVVLLQEIHRGTRAGGGQDQFAELVALTGMNGCFGKSLELEPPAPGTASGNTGATYGNAILSRAPLGLARRVRLPGGGEPRTLLRCDSLWEGAEVPLVTTHLTAWDVLNRRQRGTQVSAIAARLAAEADPLTILGGDFNASHLAPEMLSLRERSPVRPVFDSRLVTHPATRGSYDHLFVGSGWSVDEKSVVRRGPSDHWPIRATLRPAAIAESAG
jgi:endonuclease/exonuclease/phosphatase family metal-dependent hydrolase